MFLLSLLLYSQTIPLDSWVYPVLDRFETKGSVRLSNIRPYDRKEVAEKLYGLKASGIDSLYLEELKQELSPEMNYPVKRRLVGRPMTITAPPARFNLLPRLFFNYDNLSRTVAGVTLSGFGVAPPLDFSENIRISHFLAGLDTNEIDGTVWRNSAFEIGSALLTHDFPVFNLSLGKSPFFFGPGKLGGLTLSPNPFGLDLFIIKARVTDFYFTTFFSILESGRYLACHRLDVVKHHFKLGFTEMVLYAKNFELGYLNPLVPYYATQWALKRDDNIIWALDGSLFFKNFKFYGELLIDDFMYEPTKAPNKLGWTLGLQLADPFKISGMDVIIEYTRIDKWVYTQRDSLNRYVRNLGTNRTLGHFIGPDSDLLSLELNNRLSYLFAINDRISLKRKGEGRIDLPYEKEGGSPNPPFPSGVVETTIETGMGVDIRPHWRIELKPGICYEWITNRSNVRGDNKSGLKLSLAAQINL